MSETTTVIHIRHWNKADASQVYIGRPGPWGNPFMIGPDGDRVAVIERFRDWINTRYDLLNRARLELRGKTLVCYCKPLACHGDVLARIANGGRA